MYAYPVAGLGGQGQGVPGVKDNLIDGHKMVMFHGTGWMLFALDMHRGGGVLAYDIIGCCIDDMVDCACCSHDL